ncbi:unnamed protein product [Linum tenue]|uniref:Uncharacterized protein n=1 Tax=Linum tenue TaxID=586396 RepID=A0AAV0RXD0_9ROSI|nr:unnamed protein product [Linum tenue]
MIHFRCSPTPTRLQQVPPSHSKYDVSCISTIANVANEDKKKTTSTLFQPVFPIGELNTAGFLHVQTQCHLRTFYNKDYNDSINYIACVYTKDGDGFHRYEFAPVS